MLLTPPNYGIIKKKGLPLPLRLYLGSDLLLCFYNQFLNKHRLMYVYIINYNKHELT